ncbi:ATP synthase F0 subunit B [Polyangium mundeleinium]|uniref:ATP synthase subunit b n=1 Tax=Polyangium mundeleinium TaxID=2995306 RepID=A0ABT5F6N4_9BACT|nr:ATP synthase F0 subunit B [Polyangium mundeleinium]MDC0748751.1 ATP synthase F0 subunit B [Polyangium mundeleinium]
MTPVLPASRADRDIEALRRPPDPVNHLASAKLFASAINVDFDPTFIAQFILFTTFVVVLRPLLFDPLLRVFEEREKRTEGAKDDARKMDAKAGELLTKYEAELEKVRREANLEREKLRREAKELETKIMGEARDEATRILESGKTRIAAEVEQMRKELKDAQPALAAEIASRVLGREVGR